MAESEKSQLTKKLSLDEFLSIEAESKTGFGEGSLVTVEPDIDLSSEPEEEDLSQLGEIDEISARIDQKLAVLEALEQQSKQGLIALTKAVSGS